jgi:hypothetical protein
MLLLQNCGSSQNPSATKHMSPVVSLQRLPSPCTLDREPATTNLNRNPSPSFTETSCQSARISPVSCISNRFSPDHDTSAIVSSAQHHMPTCSSTSVARVREVPSTSGGIRVTLHNTQTAYAYKRISELVEPEKKVHIYGVISSITKVTFIFFLIFQISSVVTEQSSCEFCILNSRNTILCWLSFSLIKFRSQDNWVGVVTGYSVANCGSIPAATGDFLYTTESRPALGPSLPPL